MRHNGALECPNGFNRMVCSPVVMPLLYEHTMRRRREFDNRPRIFWMPSSVRSGVAGEQSSVDKNQDVQTVSVAGDLVDADPPPFRFSDYLFQRNLSKPLDLDAVATKRSVYDDPDLSSHYWPKEDYENLHRFDPTVRWTHREEKVRLLHTSPPGITDVTPPFFPGNCSKDRLESYAVGGN